VTRYPKSILLAAGLVSATGFAPLSLWPITLITIALLIALVERAPNRRAAFGYGWLFGVGHFSLGLNWIAHAFDFQEAMPHWLGYIAVVLLSLYLAIYTGGAAVLAFSARGSGPTGRGRFTVAFAAAWILTEYLRATSFTGFAWNPLAAIAVGLPAAAYVQWIGTYGLSGALVLVAGWLWWFGACVRDATTGERGRDPAHIAAVSASVAVLFLFYLGVPARPFHASTPLAVREVGPAIRIVQPNLSQAEQHDRNFDEDSVVRLEQLTGPPSTTPRLILWPEAAVPYYLNEERWARYRLAKLLGPKDILLTGGTTLIYSKAGTLIAARNSLFAMNPTSDLIARYDKAHLVPYGEYLPMRPILSSIGLSKLVQSDVDFVPGAGPGTLTLPGFGKAGVQICYEIIFSGQVIDAAHRPDFIFNPSTDAWFGAWGPPQHLAQARLRAIEEGLPVIRATPTGISAVIDAEGRLLVALPLNEPGVITSRLPLAKAPGLFARFGNSVPLTLALMLATLAIAPRFRRG
jgi:apolipoprotein N-acyltransferase